jgi:hypothetical protein
MVGQHQQGTRVHALPFRVSNHSLGVLLDCCYIFAVLFEPLLCSLDFPFQEQALLSQPFRPFSTGAAGIGVDQSKR